MLTFFCPECYAPNRAYDEVCRACGACLDNTCGDYVDRLTHFSLHHPVPTVPALAAETLGRIGDSRAVEPLIDVLKCSEEPGLLEAAAGALGMLKDERGIPALQGVLDRGMLGARLKAVEALAEIGGDEAIRALRKVAANDSCVSVRREAESVLQRLGVWSRRDGDRKKSTLGGKSGEPLATGISPTLSMLDETSSEVQRGTNGVLDWPRRDTRSQVARRRSLSHEVHETTDTERAVRDAGAGSRGNCQGPREHIEELTDPITSYGNVIGSLSDYLRCRMEHLVQGLSHVLDALRRDAREGQGVQPGHESDQR